MKDHNKHASNTAVDYLKQLITLASGVLVFSAAFIGDFKAHGFWSYLSLGTSWMLLCLCLVCGLWSMAIIVKSSIDENDNWAEGRGRTLSRISRVSFAIALFTFAVFAFISYVNQNGASLSHGSFESEEKVTLTSDSTAINQSDSGYSVSHSGESQTVDSIPESK